MAQRTRNVVKICAKRWCSSALERGAGKKSAKEIRHAGGKGSRAEGHGARASGEKRVLQKSKQNAADERHDAARNGAAEAIRAKTRQNLQSRGAGVAWRRLWRAHGQQAPCA